MAVDKNKLDVSRLFVAYVAFDGDIAKAAAACQVPAQVAEAVAIQERWREKLPEVLMTDRAVQHEINRAINYIQAHRLRRILDRVVSALGQKSSGELIDLLTRVGPKGQTEFVARPLADLARAMEACQNMTMQALGDPGAGPSSEASSSAPLGLLVMKAMEEAEKNLGVPSADIIRRELAPQGARLRVPPLKESAGA